MSISAKLVRSKSTDEGTSGTLTVTNGNSTITLKTLELPWKENKSQVSCIPTGTYTCKITNSPKFGKVYNVQNVKDRSNILIHAGNVAGDTSKGYKSDVLGCILVGLKDGELDNQTGVLNSRQALATLDAFTGGQPLELTIV